MISVYRPFLSMGLPQWIPMVYVSVFTVLMFVAEMAYAILQFMRIDKKLENLIHLQMDICLYMNMSHCVFGILASLFTMFIILSKKRVQDARVRSCYIISLMNVPYFISLVNYALSKTLFEQYGFYLVAYIAVFCFTSMLNPLIIVLLNSDLKKFMMSFLSKDSQVTVSFTSSDVRVNKAAVKPSMVSLDRDATSMQSLDT